MSKKLPISSDLLGDLIAIINQGRQKSISQVNSTLTLVFWQVGKRVNEDILKNQRADYGKEIVISIAAELSQQFGKSFQAKNLRRMMQFSTVFSQKAIVVPAARQLSWSHFLILIAINNEQKRAFYLQAASEGKWGKRELRRQIERKAYERRTIADSQLPSSTKNKTNVFKDPYFLDFLGLNNSYSESDLEAAILRELETFILELGTGFTFVERQKRMIIDGEDFYLDLLFYHRKLRRLVAIELKIGKFKAAYKGQLELYLKWLDRYDKQEGENSPIGLILCAEASREQVELLEMHKDGIMVAEYWTELPPKALLERKLHEALIAAQERIARKKINK